MIHGKIDGLFIMFCLKVFNMDKVILVVDESGAKGYSKQKEKYPGEIGVMAGFVYPEDDIKRLEFCAHNLLSPYFENTDSKVHITDLTESKQKSMRDTIYKLFQCSQVTWFYKAIYTEGFHQAENNKDRCVMTKKNMLHSKLFFGMFSQALALVKSLGITNIDILVLTDTIDNKIINYFKNEAQEIVDVYLNKPTERFTTKWKPEDKTVEKFKYTVQSNSEVGKGVESIKYGIKCEDSILTLLADVLANSVHHHLKKKIKCTNCVTKLNNREAISTHPLSNLAYVAENESDIPNFSDLVYRRE